MGNDRPDNERKYRPTERRPPHRQEISRLRAGCGDNVKAARGPATLSGHRSL